MFAMRSLKRIISHWLFNHYLSKAEIALTRQEIAFKQGDEKSFSKNLDRLLRYMKKDRKFVDMTDAQKQEICKKASAILETNNKKGESQ